MYNRPLVLGINARKAYSAQLPAKALLMRYGNNTGNLVFSEAVFRSLDNAGFSEYSFPSEDIEGCDAVVIAAANWLNPYSDFTSLADRLESYKLPVFLIGIGAQSTLDHKIPELKEGTRRLIGLVADRSKFISARGDFTCEVLSHHGVKNVMSTGCPSLLLAGSRAPLIRDIDPSLPKSIHSTRHLLNLADPFQQYIYRQALALNLELVLQSELAEIMVLNSKTHEPDLAARDVLTKSYNVADFSIVEQYVNDNAKVFYDLESWTAHLATRGFCVGTRIHGTVAGLLAGTPSLLIAHDSRTLEMAKKMYIPHVLSTTIDKSRPLDIAQLEEAASPAAFAAGYADYLQGFRSFFESNGLTLAAHLR